jgi:hypothetical protein|tara:strand:+ start:71 stop:409 length:339 start_codon:yes stop_codon:yes gene_type:complete
MTKKRKYFPNKWSQYKKAPSSYFNPRPTFEEFMDWKVSGWEIPYEVSCIIREENLCTGKIKEYVYKTDLGAKKRIKKLMEAGTSTFLVCGIDSIHDMKPEHLMEEDYEDPLA